MSARTISMVRYADDDRRLVDLIDAELLARRIDEQTIIDFSGVVKTTPQFLQRLLPGIEPRTLHGRWRADSPAVAALIVDWIEGRNTPPRLITPEVSPAAPELPESVTGPEEPQRCEHDQRYTPARIMQRLTKTFRSAIESASPLSDPLLVASRRQLLETDAEGHLLSQDPFIETTPRYEFSPLSYDQLGLPVGVAGLLTRLSRRPGAEGRRPIIFPTIYRHQEEAYRQFISAGKDLVVATGTGSGKTECFLLPILASLYREATERPDSFKRPGVRALIIYPMNALVNDQLARLRLLFGDRQLAGEFEPAGGGRIPCFGIYTGRTPYPGPRTASRDRDYVAPLLRYYLGMSPERRARLQSLGRYPAKDLDAFNNGGAATPGIYQTGQKSGASYTRHHWCDRLHTAPGDRELLTRHEMIHGTGSRPGHAPDILVTNYSMLEYMLMRPFERPIFRETREWLDQEGNQLILVLDEAHLYRGGAGAEVAFLLRRLQARLGIHGRPEKLRIIATSASLGSDGKSVGSVTSFVADLSGKSPDSFVTVTGRRVAPEPAALATPAECRMLARLDLGAINEALTPQDLRQALGPVFEFYGRQCQGATEAEILAGLEGLLRGRPCVNQLIGEAAGRARSLPDLARSVFGADELATAALEALLTLGTLARPGVDEPGLIPTRLHAIFRGLPGLYACINPCCQGRQAGPGEPASLGRLFTTPRIRCDACRARVFELASCRHCGTAYLQAYVKPGTLASLRFLWGETEGDLELLQLLPTTPRFFERTTPIDVHLRTGYVADEAGEDLRRLREQGDTGLHRQLYLWKDEKGQRENRFGRCAMCQPPSSARARISDFRTRGEEPFTTLVETQFAEQPPQNDNPTLPNRGRKVLVFSDGRQRAARLAPAIEQAHARALFRQVIAIAMSELQRLGRPGLRSLYPAVVWFCARRGENLFPGTTESRFPNDLQLARGRSLAELLQLANDGVLQPSADFGRALYDALTGRDNSLLALGLGKIDLDPAYSFIFDKFPAVGFSPAARQVVFSTWLRLQLERRRFRSVGVDLLQLGDVWERPEGLDPSIARHLLPGKMNEWLASLLGGDTAAIGQVTAWFNNVVCRTGLVDYINGLYYLPPGPLTLEIGVDRNWWRCRDCGRIHPDSIGAFCPGCGGGLVAAEPEYLEARTGCYRDQIRRALDQLSLEPFSLTAREHSAQLNGDPEGTALTRLEEYELRFQDIDPGGPGNESTPIDILSCTTTMEVGVDIGALTGVALRNVPPQVSNYQQRAGRAGRRGRSIASVVTYAFGTSHDAHFFANPAAIISGAVRAPIVNIENQQILARHISAWLLQRFFHEVVPDDATSTVYQLFESLGTVGDFLDLTSRCSLPEFELWLTRNEPLLREELRHWVPSYSHCFNHPIPEAQLTIDRVLGTFSQQLAAVLPDQPSVGFEPSPLEEEMREVRLDERLLSTLIDRAVLPRYAFPTDTVKLWVIDQRSRRGEKRKFTYQPQRDLGIALSEYAPTRTLTIDSHRYEAVAIFSPAEPTPALTLARHRAYLACSNCTYVSLDETGTPPSRCPCCDSDQLAQASFIQPTGFATDINVRPEPDRGQTITYAGQVERARLELQDPPGDWQLEHTGRRIRTWAGPARLAVVNKGQRGSGFMVCPFCGRSEPGPAANLLNPKLIRKGKAVAHDHPLESGVVCSGKPVGPFYLGYQFPTDVLLIRLKVESPFRLGTTANPRLLSQAGRVALGSLIESISLAATRELQIDESELAGWWTPIKGAPLNEAQIYLYDQLAGGAGYARSVQLAFDQVLAATERLLRKCDCVQSCYKCIRHYGNNMIHAQLDRHLALDLLRHLRDGAIPIVTGQQKAEALGGLVGYLELQQTGFELARSLAGPPPATVPLISESCDGREIWIDVHHPLVDPVALPSPVSRLGWAQGRAVFEFDAFTLVHNLPEVVAQLP